MKSRTRTAKKHNRNNKVILNSAFPFTPRPSDDGRDSVTNVQWFGCCSAHITLSDLEKCTRVIITEAQGSLTHTLAPNLRMPVTAKRKRLNAWAQYLSDRKKCSKRQLEMHANDIFAFRISRQQWQTHGHTFRKQKEMEMNARGCSILVCLLGYCCAHDHRRYSVWKWEWNSWLDKFDAEWWCCVIYSFSEIFLAKLGSRQMGWLCQELKANVVMEPTTTLLTNSIT